MRGSEAFTPLMFHVEFQEEQEESVVLRGFTRLRLGYTRGVE